MAGPLTAAGATQEPSEYATLSMDRAITGIWTQRSPLRDADVPYLYGKFYSASRFDSLIDGLNREVTSRLTTARRPGSSVYNSNTFPAINSFYPWKYIQNGAEVLRVLADGQDGKIYDATAGQKTTLFTKSSGAGKARFLGVNAELFIGDGVEQKKLLQSTKTWSANTKYTVGDFIIDTNGNIQSFQAEAVNLTISSVAVVSSTIAGGYTKTFLVVTLGSSAPVMQTNQPVIFTGLTTYTALNGQTFTYRNIASVWSLNLTANQIAFEYAASVYAQTADTGTAATFVEYDSSGNNLTGISGSSAPTWSTTQLATTQDGTVGAGVTWMCFGSPLQDWGVAAPTSAPTVTPGTGVKLWQPNTVQGSTQNCSVIVDANGSYQVVVSNGGTTGNQPPNWSTGLGSLTYDNTVTWRNIGTQSTWLGNYVYTMSDVVILDNNGNLQWATKMNYGPLISAVIYAAGVKYSTAGPCTVNGGTGSVRIDEYLNADGSVLAIEIDNPGDGYASSNLSTNVGTVDTTNNGYGLTVSIVAGRKTSNVQPTWNQAIGGTTTDNNVTWINLGPGTQLANGTVQYAYSYHCIDGTVTTASDTVYVLYGALGPAGGLMRQVTVKGTTNLQVDQIWIWRTAQGQSTLVYCDAIPNPGTASNVVYNDIISDTSTAGQQALIPQIVAPIANEADPPLTGITAPVYHLQRVWAIVDNQVVYSAGPDAVTGNGNTQWPALNNIPYPEQPIRLIPFTVNNGGLLVMTTSHVYVILGTGTATNPFYTTMYMPNVGIMSYDALDIVGSTLYLMTNKGKFVSLDPSAGYTEAGFPIGDQFTKVTTGGISSALYNPSSTFVTWHEQSSGDTAIYVADGSVGWFRFSPVASPESGYMWSPRAAIAGGTSAVQSVEVSPGNSKLLIAPASSGPILFRDSTTNADNGTAYPSWDVKGNIVLCQSGEVAEIAHIALKSTAVGARPTVSILLGEITPTTSQPFEPLSITSADPPNLPKSTTIYSDRYTALQNGVCPKCDNFQLKIDYGTQNFPDELLMFSVYGAKHAERRQQ